jgi:hypothetical protein
MKFEQINRELWSRSSQRSSAGHYDSLATHYEGIAYRCLACEASCVFTPEEQKVAYEVNKKFVWWQPRLCAVCRVRLEALQEQDRRLQSRWNQERNQLNSDAQFLAEWLTVLEGLRAHGKPNESMERMLQKRLKALPCA